MSTVAMRSLESAFITIACDERCAVVRQLAHLVKWWDSTSKRFRFVERNCADPADRAYLAELDSSRWSLILIDETQNHWSGPEAIPIILKNLPFGKIACVLYILPGTMWLTHQLYMLVSRNHRRVSPPPVATELM
jgi:predicted DCC family thiol-disulfide oxidoreductase YuxK